jgi:hypothetical protein
LVRLIDDWLHGANGLAAHATAVNKGADTLVDLDETPQGANTVLLQNGALANLHAGDFIVHLGIIGF